MYKWILWYSLVFLGGGNLFGEDVTITSAIRSKYVFSNGDMLYDKPLIQTDIYISFKNGFWLDIWGSIPTDISNVGKDYATELYTTGGWAGKISNYKIKLGLGYDDLHSTGTFDKTDFLIIIGEISKDFQVYSFLSFSPFLHVETNFTFDGKVMGDTLPRLGTYYSWKINDRVSLDGKAYVLYDPGILFNQTALIGNIEGSLHWKINEHVVVEFPSTRFVDPLNHVSDGRKAQRIFGAGLVIKF